MQVFGMRGQRARTLAASKRHRRVERFQMLKARSDAQRDRLAEIAEAAGKARDEARAAEAQVRAALKRDRRIAAAIAATLALVLLGLTLASSASGQEVPPCVRSENAELAALGKDYKCPDPITSIELSGDHARVEEVLHTSIKLQDRSDLPTVARRMGQVSLVAQTIQAAMGAYSWINERYKLAAFHFVVKSSDDTIICQVELEATPAELSGPAHVVSADCGGVGNGKEPRSEPEQEPEPTPKPVRFGPAGAESDA